MPAPIRYGEGRIVRADVLVVGGGMARAVVGAGGPRAGGPGFELDSTAGQPAAGSVFGADAGLMAGFWSAPPGERPTLCLWLPLVMR